MPAAVAREKKIKSAERVLDIFEMFSQSRQCVTVMEVARKLGAPQSSTSELLSSLVRRGYLVRERNARVFRPTARVALLGSWVQPDLFRHGGLLPMMDQLHEMTGESVVLASMVGVSLKHLHAVGDMPEDLAEGTDAHLLRSPLGHALLSTIYPGEVRLIAQRLNAESDPDFHVRHTDLSDQLDRVNRVGYATGEVAEGWTGLSVLLPRAQGEDRLALGIVGKASVMDARRDELLRQMRQAVSEFLGPRIAHESSTHRIHAFSAASA